MTHGQRSKIERFWGLRKRLIQTVLNSIKSETSILVKDTERNECFT